MKNSTSPSFFCHHCGAQVPSGVEHMCLPLAERKLDRLIQKIHHWQKHLASINGSYALGEIDKDKAFRMLFGTAETIILGDDIPSPGTGFDDLSPESNYEKSQLSKESLQVARALCAEAISGERHALIPQRSLRKLRDELAQLES